MYSNLWAKIVFSEECRYRVSVYLSIAGKPVIHSVGIDDSHIQTPVGSNVTLYCSYQANPAVALYQWEVNPVFPPSTFSYVYPLPHQLTLVSVTARDAAFYTCNVTNWCGSATAVHILFVIGEPPSSLLYRTHRPFKWGGPICAQKHHKGPEVELVCYVVNPLSCIPTKKLCLSHMCYQPCV